MVIDSWWQRDDAFLLVTRSHVFFAGSSLEQYEPVPGHLAARALQARFHTLAVCRRMPKWNELAPMLGADPSADPQRALVRELRRGRASKILLYRRSSRALGAAWLRPVAPPAAAPEPAAEEQKQTCKVLSAEWGKAEAWCSDSVPYSGKTEGCVAGAQHAVLIQDAQGRTAGSHSLAVSGGGLSASWQVKDVLPPKAGAGFAKEAELSLKLGGVAAPKALKVRFIPGAKKKDYAQDRHHFSLEAKDYALTVSSEIKFVPGWAAQVVNLGSKVPSGTGGLLDGALAWSGYRWMKQDGVKNKYWDGKDWQPLPKGFVLADSNHFAVGFYEQGKDFVCQYGGKWPEAFTAWDIAKPAKQKKIDQWTKNIDDTWTGKLDLKRKECKSAAKACCRYSVKAKVTFSKQAAFAKGMLIIADGDIRSNDSLFFLGEPRLAMAAHEFGHHIGNPDEYAGAVLDTSLNDDGAKAGIDADSIMGQNMTTVKVRHFRLVAKVFADMVKAESGQSYTYEAVKP